MSVVDFFVLEKNGSFEEGGARLFGLALPCSGWPITRLTTHTNSKLQSSRTLTCEVFSILTTTANMSALNKIAANSPSRAKPSDLETSIAGALYDLETNTTDLKAALRPLQFVSAREVSN